MQGDSYPHEVDLKTVKQSFRSIAMRGSFGGREGRVVWGGWCYTYCFGSRTYHLMVGEGGREWGDAKGGGRDEGRSGGRGGDKGTG
jgi:hypothetical protein